MAYVGLQPAPGVGAPDVEQKLPRMANRRVKYRMKGFSSLRHGRMVPDAGDTQPVNFKLLNPDGAVLKARQRIGRKTA